VPTVKPPVVVVEDSQSLTDSELFVIDNLCKDMYLIHNETIQETGGAVANATNRRVSRNQIIEKDKLLPFESSPFIYIIFDVSDCRAFQADSNGIYFGSV
jgi:hypothetical protein